MLSVVAANGGVWEQRRCSRIDEKLRWYDEWRVNLRVDGDTVGKLITAVRRRELASLLWGHLHADKDAADKEMLTRQQKPSSAGHEPLYPGPVKTTPVVMLMKRAGPRTPGGRTPA
ncbi:hypothetical protein NPX13_g6141 [Xylaria arbuscula]|uniref:Uncharacterized protein n=1 Tax=Xylaria arbuscula TaxID=114810 RepID=A0A9W8ND37_9PEZI|nr:hypothetical protein NPX13_g6141 [Xylaria arbuscula]